MKSIKMVVLIVAAVFTGRFSADFVYAQTLQCDTPVQKAQCQLDLAQAEADAKAAQAQLVSAQAESSSLKRDINVLDAKIKVAQANIKAKNLLIQTLGNDITQKQSHINDLEDHVAKGKETLATILRKTNEIDANTLPEVLLSQSSVTGFFQDLDTFQSVQEGLKLTFDQLRSDEAQTSTEKDALDKRRNTESDARYAIQQEQKNIQGDQTQKTQLLTISKGNEKSYSTLLAQKQAKAAQIRAALFQLAGAKAIPFGDALKFAQEAQRYTSIRPAFLLAIITQESNLGANVGSCYVTDLTTGNGVGKNTGSLFEQVMKAPRDTSPFVNITKSLGIDWATTPVSCPIGSAKYYVGRGFGGAMGPAQFIPSTWDNGTATSFKNRVAKTLGIASPNPWNPEHAFIASALYLTDLGGVGYSGEIKAACKYFGTGGSSCSYGKQVIAKADNIQSSMIDQLAGL